MKLRSSASWLLLATFAVVQAASSPAGASHHVFSSSVDRFEVDGNVFGPFDGTLDYVDEFDNGTIAPDWSTLLGTNVESGGVATFKNPGTDITLGSVSLDVSNIENEEDITDGMGDATVNSYWLPALPNAGTELHMQLYGVGSTIEAAGLAVGNGTAGAFVSEQLTHIVYPSTFTNVLTETVMINPGDITGQIVLRMTVDDAANTATGSFSLDGGTTFQSPFSSMPIFAAASSYELLLGAGAVESVPPGPTPTPTPPPTPQLVGSKLILVKNGGDPTTRKAIYIGRQPGGTLTNPIGFGATFRLQIDGNSQCFTLPSALWTAHLHGYTYADRNGTFGPVKTVKVSATVNGGLQIKVKISGHLGLITVVPPNPGAQADTNLSIGGAQYCSSSAGATIRPNNAKTFKAGNAPPPVACNVAACP